MNTPIKCPVCDSTMSPTDLPRFKVHVCRTCNQIVQEAADGTIVPIQSLLERNALGDDQVRAAITQPHVVTVKSFLDVLEQAERARGFIMAQATGGLRQVLAQIENRIDSALAAFTGLDLASDRAGDGLNALREARELVSTLPARTRGVPQDGGGGAESD